jgi:hypothetical protein
LFRATLDDLAQRISGPIRHDPHPALPDTFAPDVYLLRNPDLAPTGVDPVPHFLTIGGWQNSPWRMRRNIDGAAKEQRRVILSCGRARIAFPWR